MTLSAATVVFVLSLHSFIISDTATIMAFPISGRTTTTFRQAPVTTWAVLDENNENNNNNNNKNRRSGDEDFSLDNIEYTGTVDWDAEWKKVSQDKDFLKNRPGSDFYKSEAEIAAIVRGT
jgi:hypothetical protein